jgi:tetratricopeptide (TPR) repeat protein
MFVACAALTVSARLFEVESADDLDALNRQVFQLYQAGKYAEAQEIAKRALAVAERRYGLDHPNVATSLNNLAELYRKRGLYGEAEPLYKRSLAIREKALGRDHRAVALALNNLALLYRAEGRFGEAEPLFKRSLAIAEKALGPDHPDLAKSLSNLAGLYESQGLYGEAEPLYKRTLAISERSLGPDHPDVATSLNNLALLYLAQGRYGEADPLFKRSLAIAEKALGPDHPDVANSLNNLAGLYESQGRYEEAAPLYQRSLAIREKVLGPNHPDVAASLNNLAERYRNQGMYGEAEPLYKRSLAIREKALGSDHRAVGTALNNLALLYRVAGRYGEAEPLYKRSLAIAEKALGPNHPDVGKSLNNLAGLYLVQRDWARAADHWRRSTSVIVRRVQGGMGGGGETLTGKRRSETQQLRSEFVGLVKVVHRLVLKEPNSAGAQAGEMFETAQWAHASEAAMSLAQMATRGAKGDRALAALVRERQDLVAEWQRRDGTRTKAVSRPPGKRNKDEEAANAVRLGAIDKRISEIDTTLKDRFPDYAALVSPVPLSVRDVQGLLAADEALILFLDTPEWKPTSEETFIWVITKGDMRWVRSGLGTKQLTQRVGTLRSGLDQSATTRIVGDRAATGIGDPEQARNFETVGTGRERNFLPFDFAAAHELYASLFGPIADVITDKHLLIVPSGALTQLPFQVLITDKQDPALSGTEAFRRGAWLIRNHALTVLPSVSSLKALRQLAKESHASRTLIGFGNPLLEGPDARYVTLAAAARSKT